MKTKSTRSSDKKNDLYILRHSYCYNKILYNMSFKDRLDIALGKVSYPLFRISDDINKMREKELIDNLLTLKKPWWDGIINYIENGINDEHSFVYKCLELYCLYIKFKIKILKRSSK